MRSTGRIERPRRVAATQRLLVSRTLIIVLIALVSGVLPGTAVTGARSAWAAGQDASTDEVLSERIASYEMEVLLNHAERELIGNQVLTWQNATQHPADELRFHLYYNAWRNDRSSFFRGYRHQSMNTRKYREGEWAWCDVRSMRVLEGDGREPSDISGTMTFVQPNDGNPHDRTVLAVPIDPPVAPGETIRLRIEWTSKVPRTFRRTGVRGTTYFLAQWFPKIGVFEQNGEWNCHQFTGTEFFADYGNYDVKLIVPDSWVVGATGRRIIRTKNADGTAMHRFVQNDVHDFAWTASPDYIVHEQEFESSNLPDVRMRLLLQPDHKNKKQRYFDATAKALQYYGSWFGAYPYGHITIVDPAYKSGSGGMEYPTLFTGGTRLFSPASMLSPEGVTIHEAGHQWWYGIVGNNEFEHAWLDEGLNTYSEERVQHEACRPQTMSRRYFNGIVPLTFRELPATFRLAGADRYRGFESTLKRDSMATESWRLGPGTYGLLSYTKPALMLRTLENTVGWDTMQKIMSTYFERWKFRHPKPQDFFDVVNEVAQRDFGWFFDAAYYGSGLFDYGVDQVRSRRADRVRGYIEDDEGIMQWQDRKSRKDAGHEEPQYESAVLVRRWGDAIFPIDVRITFADGESVTETWDGQDRWKRFDYLRAAKVTRVEVDPERKLVLDINSVNNTWVKDSKARTAGLKWATRWTVWMQNMLEQLAFFS